MEYKNNVDAAELIGINKIRIPLIIPETLYKIGPCKNFDFMLIVGEQNMNVPFVFVCERHHDGALIAQSLTGIYQSELYKDDNQNYYVKMKKYSSLYVLYLGTGISVEESDTPLESLTKFDFQ